MSTTEFEDEFEQLVAEIETLKANVSEDEQNFVDSWISKIRNFDTDGEKGIHLQYLRKLKSQLVRDSKRLSLPFLNMPPDSELIPLGEYMDSSRPRGKQQTSGEERRRYIHGRSDPKPPCPPKTRVSKPMERQTKSERNEFEDVEEMAKCIARSKGKILPEFVADISRHTADKGRELRAAMKEEVTSFSECVERVMSQRNKDLMELLDDKQSQELNKIQKKYDHWQSELSLCKTELKAIVPDFDMNAYRKDRNYLKKFFSVSSSNPPAADEFKEWKELKCHRIAWFSNETSKLMKENNQILEMIGRIKTEMSGLEREICEKDRLHDQYMRSESAIYQSLKEKSDKLAKEITDLLISPEN